MLRHFSTYCSALITIGERKLSAVNRVKDKSIWKKLKTLALFISKNYIAQRKSFKAIILHAFFKKAKQGPQSIHTTVFCGTVERGVKGTERLKSGIY